MLTLQIKKTDFLSHSSIKRKALYFKKYREDADFCFIEVSLWEIIDNWNRFSAIYTVVAEWSETSIEYDKQFYNKRSDKQKIYEALKLIYADHLQESNSHILSVRKKTSPSNRLFDLPPELLTNNEINELIDLMSTNKRAKEAYRNRFTIG